MLLVLKNLSRRPLRSFLAVLGIAIGIAAVVGLISLARGFQNGLDDLLTRLRGDIIIKQKDCVTPQSSRIDAALVDELATVEGVRGVSGYTFEMLFFGEFQVPIYGFDPDQPISRKVRVVAGRRIAHGALREVMVGAEAARHLGLAPGQTITVPPSDPHGSRMKVVGIFSTGSRYQDIGCIVPLRTAQVVGKMPHQVMMIALDVVDRDRAEEVRDRLRQRLKGMDVLLAREFTEHLGDLQMVHKFAWAVSAIAAVVGAIGVLNTMLMSVIERTREIGMLLALGWSRARVLGMIMAEGLAVSLVGGGLGIAMGVAMVDLLSEFLEELPVVGGHDARLFAQAMALSVGLGLLGSLLPAYKASRLSPVEALRYE